MKKNDNELFKELLIIATKIIGNDYGCVYLFHENKGEFVYAIGHDLEKLKEIPLKKEGFYTANEIFIVKNILEEKNAVFQKTTHEQIKTVSKPISETLICPLYLNKNLIGGFAFDLDSERKGGFTDEDIEISKVFKEIAETFLTIKEFNNNLNLSYMNEKLQKEKFIELTGIISGFSESFDKCDMEFFTNILKSSEKILGNDCSSIYIFDGPNWKFVDTIGYDIEQLKSLDLKKEYCYAYYINDVELVDKIIYKNSIPESIRNSFENSSIPIKSSIVCPLIQNGEKVGGINFDIIESNTMSFNEEDLNVAKAFKNIIETFMNIRYFNSKIKETSLKLEEYNTTLEIKVKERTKELEIAHNKINSESRLLLEAEARQREIAEELKNSVIEMTSTLKITEVYSIILNRLSRIINYSNAVVFDYKNNSFEFISSISEVSAKNLLEVKIIRKDNQVYFKILSDDNDDKNVLISDKISFYYLDDDHKKLFFPIKTKDAYLGLIMIEIKERFNPNLVDNMMLITFIEQAALALQNAKLFEEIDCFAKFDGLTKVYNRRYFYELAINEFNLAKMYETQFCVMMLDIDHFKKFNDTYGHHIGDETLRIIALTIKENIRETDILGRYGGEEFIILMPGISLETAGVIAEKIRKKISEKPLVLNSDLLNISASIGVAKFSSLFENIDQLIAFSDLALYESKNSGRNKVTIVSD